MNGAKSLAAVVAASCVLWAVEAAAMCGCFVQPPEGQAAPDLFADATQVALARDGTRTVLTMQNNYKGPVKDFALVIPVPEVLEQSDVSVIDPAIFGRFDVMTSPRLFEFEELDPCPEIDGPAVGGGGVAVNAPEDFGGGRGGFVGSETPPEVIVEAEFEVDAYEIVILSADDSTGLLTWLGDNGYDVPSETADVLQGYITQGMYFFVAKVDPSKVAFNDGEAVLPPLRFEYDSEEFSLPVRLGTVNSPGTQDVIAYVISEEGRFETANYEQIEMPTNVEVSADVREDFGGFYRALYDQAAAGESAFAATEFAVTNPVDCWDCGLGWFGDTYWGDLAELTGQDTTEGEPVDRNGTWNNATVTRLHIRVGADGPVEDVVFRKADELWGGQNSADGISDFPESPEWANGRSQFVSRYVIRNYWTGPVRCAAPTWGRWQARRTDALTAPSPNNGGVTEAAAEPIEQLVREDLPTLGITTTNPPPEPGELASGCGCAAPGSGGAPAGGLALFALGVFGVRRARRARHGD